ncbi:MAG TPA: neutral zinc metallopeptidase [Candidatus Dormibacteraeota bacterium]
MVAAMFNDVQAKWHLTFEAAGLTYSPAVLRIFTSEVGTACGHQTAEVIEQALKAAAVVGDDFLTHLQGGQVEPENWTHGSSAQRQHWLTVGFDSGAPASCDTFSGSI